MDGLDVGGGVQRRGVSGHIMDTNNTSELQLTLSGGLGDAQTGGINLNIIPKTARNTRFKGTFFTSFSNDKLTSSNVDDQLRSFGIANFQLVKVWDLERTSVAARSRGTACGSSRTRAHSAPSRRCLVSLRQRQRGDPNSWTYVGGERTEWPAAPPGARNANSRTIGSARLTAQASKRDIGQCLLRPPAHLRPVRWYCKMQTAVGRPVRIGSRQEVSGVNAPEAFNTYADTYQRVMQATWTSVVTNSCCSEAGFSSYVSRWGGCAARRAHQPDSSDGPIPARAVYLSRYDNYFNNWQSPNVYRASGFLARSRVPTA